MSKIDTVANRVIELTGSTISEKNIIRDNVGIVIRGLVTDAVNLMVNINTTSLGQDDYDKRINEMCKQFGFTHSLEKFF